MPEMSGQETISTELEQACAEEPIHIIGTVQPHGFVLVVDIATTRIVQVSSGAARHWKGLAQSADLLQIEIADRIDGFGADPASVLGALPRADPIVLPLRPRLVAPGVAARSLVALASKFECVGHRVGDLAILEWQPLGNAADALTSSAQGMVAITSSLLRLRTAKALDAFYRDCVREVALLCGFDRVMLYRFLPDWTGEVIAEEASGKLKTRFLGLRFPASDIPSQARALYANSRIRVLADVLAVSDTLLPPLLPGDVPLDQSHSLLRGFSEVHQTYLKNMGVRATMSLSIVCDGKLWGLIACHHYQPRVPPHHVRETLRQVCELVAGVSAMRIETMSQLAMAHNTVALDQLLLRVYQAVLPEESIRAALSSLVPALLSTFEASAFCVRIGDFQYVGGATHSTASDADITQELIAQFGANPPPAAVLLRTDLLTSNATALATLPAAAGLLAVQQTGQTLDICAFTRPEVVREVDWAGAPVKRVATAADGRVRLEPRNSFALWKQEIGGTARPWSPAEAEACQRLLRILGDACRRRKHKALEQELRWHAHHDHLTGLVNRRSMEESLDQRLGAHCYDSAVMLIDLDHFKMINDTHGHAAGDHLLQALATRLGAVVRPTDILSRVGGDEFLLLAEMPLPDHALAMAIAARLHAAVEEPFDVLGHSVRLGLSVGISIPPEHGINATDLMRRADLALYRAKKSGRASTVIFDAKLEEGLLGTYELERDLQEAVGRNELSLVFQPQVNLSSGRVVGLEALVRWTHPARGSIGAGVFIPIAERSDLILQIGQWVVRTAIATMADWRLRGRTSPPISVNVSMTEVMSGTLVDTIGRQLREFQLPAECLTVELTESVIMKDPRVAMSVLSALKVLGVSTALDDFGTGYSSLSYLRQLPLACLKVDQSFIADLTRDAHSRSLTQAIIRMAEALKMTTIAEGVETRGQLQWLRSHKCDIGQGYLFSPAVPAELVHATNERIEAAWMGLHHGEVLRLT
jgi:diguanylate cyclase (GGDEF)-like protein